MRQNGNAEAGIETDGMPGVTYQPVAPRGRTLQADIPLSHRTSALMLSTRGLSMTALTFSICSRRIIWGVLLIAVVHTWARDTGTR